eukprot:5164996-Prymnesium_polylepis.1
MCADGCPSDGCPCVESGVWGLCRPSASQPRGRSGDGTAVQCVHVYTGRAAACSARPMRHGRAGPRASEACPRHAPRPE